MRRLLIDSTQGRDQRRGVVSASQTPAARLEMEILMPGRAPGNSERRSSRSAPRAGTRACLGASSHAAEHNSKATTDFIAWAAGSAAAVDLGAADFEEEEAGLLMAAGGGDKL
jgi:hypothetical protein